jgi:hypothetical protein
MPLGTLVLIRQSVIVTQHINARNIHSQPNRSTPRYQFRPTIPHPLIHSPKPPHFFASQPRDQIQQTQASSATPTPLPKHANQYALTTSPVNPPTLHLPSHDNHKLIYSKPRIGYLHIPFPNPRIRSCIALEMITQLASSPRVCA